MAKGVFLSLFPFVDKDGNTVYIEGYVTPPEVNTTFEQANEESNLQHQLSAGIVPEFVNSQLSPSTGSSAEDVSDLVSHQLSKAKEKYEKKLEKSGTDD